MRRLHLFEFEDQAWFPERVRDLMTDFLRHVTIALKLHRPMTDVLARALEASRVQRIIDLCSGGGGLLVALQGDLDRRGTPTEIVFTDKYPNRRALDAVCREAPDRLRFDADPVDACAVPEHYVGVRTLFSAFHHFRPDTARAILADAAERDQAIAVFEVSRRSLSGLVPMLLTPLAVWVFTPMIRPFRWDRLLFTYVIPAVPFFLLWDGLVSALRTYKPEEMLDMSEGLGGPGYRWEAATVDAPHGYKVTFLLGLPA